MKPRSDDFELKRALDALPRTIEPPDDLWPAVRATIAARGRRRRIWSWPEAWEPRTIRIAAGIGVIGIGLAVLAAQTRAGATWYVSQYVGNTITTDARRVNPGETFVTGSGPDAHLPPRPILGSSSSLAVPRTVLRIGSIGRVELAPHTRVRQLAARASEHRLALDRGMIHARIDAPPRLFVVETPTGTAIDLGCEYTLHVDSAGNTVLHVQLGWVEFARGRAEALIPAGFMVINHAGGELGIPVRENASGQVRWAAAVLEQTPRGVRADSAARVLAAYARHSDAVTLWHALPRVSAANRDVLYTSLARRAPPPAGVTEEGVLAGDRLMMRLWWESLPGGMEITPRFVKRLWLLWLRAASWL
jgi:hypothetical protein